MKKREYYSGEDAFIASQYSKESKYWLKKLSGDLVKSGFPFDTKSKNRTGREMDTVSIEFDGELTSRLLRMINQSDSRLHMVLAAGVVLLLDKYTGNRDIILGAPIDRQEIEGDFINTVLPLRIPVEDDMSFKELLFRVRETVIEACDHQNYPLEALLYDLGMTYSGDSDFPLFDTMVLLENIHEENYIRHVNPSVVFYFSRKEEKVQGVVQYNMSLYRRQTMESIAAYFIHLLRQALFNVDSKLRDMDVLSEEDRRKFLVEFNSTGAEYPRDKTIQQLFEEQAQKTPHRTAVVYRSYRTNRTYTTYTTYQTLNEKSNQLAHVLRRKGVKPGTFAGVMMGHSLEMIISILGVLKAGGGYLPIDPDAPGERLVSMLEDTQALVLLTEKGVVDRHLFASLQGLHSSRQQPHVTAGRFQIRDLDRLPFPDRSLIDYEKYIQHIGHAMVKHCFSLQATRGCPYKCLYCHKIWPKAHMVRSAENIFAEVQHLYGLGVRRFALIDDVFNMNIENSSRFFRLILENGLKVQFYFPNGMRGDILTREYIDLMVEAGTVSLALALETASPRLQKLICKNLNLDKLRENIQYLCQAHPHVILELNTMHGFPTETEEEAQMTLDFIKSLKWVHFPYINILKIYPNTDMERLALESGIDREAIARSEHTAYHELPDTLPFDKAFTLKYQADFLNSYFLSRERLLHVLPHQQEVLTVDELVQKYDSYLPTKVSTFSDLLHFIGITLEELKIPQLLPDDHMAVPGLNEKLKASFPEKTSSANALKVLLLDLSQFFSTEGQMIYDVVEPPLGLLYLMTYLNREFGDKVKGKIAKSRVDFDNFTELKALLEDFKPDVIGLRTLTFYKNFFHQTAALIRQWGFEKPVIAGGPYATSGYMTLLQDPAIDLVVLGEGEVTFAELIGKIIDKRGVLPDESELRDISGLAFIPAVEKQRKPGGREIFLAEHFHQVLADVPIGNPLPVNSPADLAYTIFTSGSTGRPKGVLVPHQGAVNYLCWAAKTYVNGQSLNFPLHTSISFDLTVTSVFTPLITGNTVVVYGAGEKELLIHKIIEDTHVGIIKLTPSHLKLIREGEVEGSRSYIKAFIVGGEELEALLAGDISKNFNEKVVIYNEYGPTEASVGCMIYRYNSGVQYGRSVPIGVPADNVQIYLLDRSGKTVPAGVSGELFISGHGLARGYLNNPELTAEKFLNKSFCGGPGGGFFKKSPLAVGDIFYKTGDLARWLSSGDIEFLGRVDEQVKIRGYRIEPGEIESRLMAFEPVKQAVVIIREDNTGDRQLAAYVVPRQGHEDSGQLQGDILHYLKGKLPEYMIPAHIVILETIPLTAGGKIDRGALPEPGAGVVGEHVAPRNEIERKLAGIWSEVLGIEKDIIGIDTNFFQLGGHSLKATTLASRLHKELNVKVPLAQIFKTPFIRGLSEYLQGVETVVYTAIEPVEQKEYFDVSHSQKRVWVVSQMEGGSAAFNIPEAYLLEGRLDKPAFRDVFFTLVERHESLRTVFSTVEGEPKQRIRSVEEIGFRIDEIDLRNETDREVKALELANSEENILFDLVTGPLLRVKLLQLEEEKHLLLINMHHIISDAVSMEVLISEILTLYEAYTRAEPNPLKPLQIQYKDFAAWQNRRLGTVEAETHRRYWQEQLGGDLPVLELPTDKERPKVMTYSGDTISFPIDETVTRRLKQVGEQNDATLFMVLAAALDVLLYGYSGETDIIIGTPAAGREHADLENQVGFYLNTLALRVCFDLHDTFTGLLKKTRQSALAAYEHQAYPFDKLVEDLKIGRDVSRHPIFNVVLNMINYTPPADYEFARLLKISPFEAGYHKTKFDLTLYIYEGEKTLTVTFEYNVDLFAEKTIRFMGERFRRLLDAVTRCPEKSVPGLLLEEKVELPAIESLSFDVTLVPASFHQERLWFIDAFEADRLYDGGPVYHNIPLIVKINGLLEVDLLEKSIQEVIRRHPALRTRIAAEENKCYQSIQPNMEFKLQVRDIEGDRDDERLRLAMEVSRPPFRLDKDPLIRGVLMRWADQKFLLVMTLHHMIADKKSLEILVREMALNYEALSGNKLPGLPDLPLHYADFSRWQQAFPEEASEALLFYWKRKLHGKQGKLLALEIPVDRPRALIHIFHGTRQSFTFPPALAEKIMKFSSQEGAGHFVLLLAAFKVLLHIYCRQEEIVVGTSAPNREHPGTEGIIGPIANLLVLRSFISQRLTFREIVNDVHSTVKEAYRFQDLPFDQLVLALNPDIDMSRTALFDVLFQYEEKPLSRISVGSVAMEVEETNLGWGKYDLNLLMQRKESETFGGVLVYNADYYDDSRISRFIGHYRVLLENMLANPHQSISCFGVLTPQEKHQLLVTWNSDRAAYPDDKTIHQLFAEQVEKTPDAAAAHATHRTYRTYMTYKELNKKSVQLAHLLMEKGVQPDSIVGIMVERSIEMIFGILGILKAGGAYLPIDPDYPEERIDFMLNDSGVEILLSEVSKMSEVSGDIEVIDLTQPTHPNSPTHLTHLTQPTHLIYVIYTSGTTGRPKGVLVEHGNVVSLFFNEKFQFDFSSRDVWTMFHSHCFDFSVWEIFGALLFGGKVVVVPKMVARDTQQYLSIVKNHCVTVLNQTPSAFYHFIDVESNREERDLHLRYVIFGGEALSPGKLKKWWEQYPRTRLINMFGITETTVHVTYKEITDFEIDNNIGNIGKPIPTLTGYIIDESQRLLPVGVDGEFHIGGAGVSRGYLNRAQLTAEKFIKNPYKKGEKLYRSGDRVRVLENGEMIYSGRVDQQVQLRGFRIELGEIENQILKYDKGKIKQAVVVDREDLSGDTYLCAYIVPGTAGVFEKASDITDLRQYLSRSLPDYMIPSQVVKLDRIPLTANGKVDRKALPEPEIAAAEEYIAPRDAVEKELAATWSDVLAVPAEGIGIDANFFELGGHSLKATLLAARMQKTFHVKIGLVEIFQLQTIRELASFIRNESGQPFTLINVEAAEEKEYYALAAEQRSMYFAQQDRAKDSTHLNMPKVVELEGVIPKEKMASLFAKLIKRHENLRTSFHFIDGEPVFRIHKPGEVDFKIEYYHIENPVTIKGDGHQWEAVGEESPADDLVRVFIRPFPLDRPPLFRAAVIKVSAEKYLLAVDIHHIISDGFSWDLFFKEFSALDKGTALPPLKLQYKDYSQWQNNRKIEGALQEQEAYWLKTFAGKLPMLELPFDYPRPTKKRFAGGIVRFEMDAQQTAALRKLAKEKKSTLFMLLLAVYNVLLHKLSGQEDIIVGTTIAGRRHPDLERIIGMFVNILPLRNYPKASKTFNEFFKEVTLQTMEAFENQDYHYYDLLEKVAINEDLGRGALFDTFFVIQNMGEAEAGLEMKGLTAAPRRFEKRISNHDLTFEGYEKGDQLVFNVEYASKLFKRQTVEQWVTVFKTILSSVLENPAKKIAEINIYLEKPESYGMKITEEIKTGYEKLSPLGITFLEFLRENPESLKSSSYHSLEWVDGSRFLPWPFFIGQQAKKEFEEAAVRVFKLIRSIPKKVFGFDAEKMSTYYGIDPDTINRYLYKASDKHISQLVGRGDFIHSPTGLKCIEFNIASNLGGWEIPLWEDMYLELPVLQRFIKTHKVKFTNRNLLSILLEHLFEITYEKFSNHSKGITIAIVLPGHIDSPYNRLQEEFINRIYKDVIQDTGMKGQVVLCDYPDLQEKEGYAFYRDIRIHTILEMSGGYIPLDMLMVLEKGNVLVYNGPISGVLANKLNLALLSELQNSEIFTPAERETIKKHIPWTRKIVDEETFYGTERISLTEFILSHRKKLVMKIAEGYGGKSVFVGRYTMESQWQALLKRALKENNWLVQEYMESYPFISLEGDKKCSEHLSVLGLFVFGSRYGGAYARGLAKNNNTGLINHSQGAGNGIVFEVDDTL